MRDDDYLNYLEDEPLRTKSYSCGGYSSWTGHCGAEDCETCHPGGAARIARDAAYDTWMSVVDAPLLTALVKVKALLSAVEAMIETGRDAEFAVSGEVRDEIQARAAELADIAESVAEEG